MTSLFSPKPSIRSRPTRNGGLGGFVQVEVLAEEYGDSPTSVKEKRSSMINLFEKKRKRRSAPPPLAINLAQQGFVESAVTTGESFGFNEETEMPPVPSLPRSPLRSASSPLTTMVTWQNENDTAATDRDSTVVQIGEVRGTESWPASASASESSRDAQKPQNLSNVPSPPTPQKSDGEPPGQISRGDTIAITQVAPRRTTPGSISISPVTPRAERESELFLHLLPLRTSPSSPDECSLPTPIDKALPPLPPDSIQVIKHFLEPIELPGSILLPNQGFDFPSLVPDQLSVRTVKTASTESTDDSISTYSRTTSGSLPSLSAGSSPENKMGKFSSPRKKDAQLAITAPVESMENMDMDQLLNELPNYPASVISSVWIPAMKAQIQELKENESVAERKMQAAIQACAASSLKNAKNAPLLAFAQHMDEIRTSVQDCAAKYYESKLDEPPALTSLIEQLNKDLDKAREEINTAHTLIEEDRGCISDQSNLIGALHETHDADVNTLTKYIIRHARQVLSQDNGDYLTREVWDIMRTYAIPMIMDDKTESTSDLLGSSTASNISSPTRSRPLSPSGAQPNSPERPSTRSVRISEDQYIALLQQCRDLQSKLISSQRLAAEQQEALQHVSTKSDEYLEQIRHHAKLEQSQDKEIEYLRNEVKLFKMDVKGYKEDQKEYEVARAAVEQLAIDKVGMERDLQTLKETLSQRETEVTKWKLEAQVLRNEFMGDNRPSSEASHSSGTSLKPAQVGFAKSFPKLWHSSFNSRNKPDGSSQKESSSPRCDHSNGPAFKSNDCTIDIGTAGHCRSRSQSVGGINASSRKLPSSKSMLQIDNPKMVPVDASSLPKRHQSQRDTTKTSAREANATNNYPSTVENSKGRNSSSPDEGMTEEMKFYGIDSPARPIRSFVKEPSQSTRVQTRLPHTQPRGELEAPRRLEETPLHLVSQTNVQQNILRSPKVNDILGIQERSDNSNASKSSVKRAELGKTSSSPHSTLRPRKSQNSLVSKSSSKDSGTSQSTTSKTSNPSSSSCLGTAVKMTRGNARLTVITDKKLPDPPGNLPPRASSRRDTTKAPATAPMLTPSRVREYLDLDPAKPKPRSQIHDRYPGGGVLDSPLETTVNERYPSQGVLNPGYLQPPKSQTYPNLQVSDADKKVEVDEQDYNDGSPAQRSLRRKCAIRPKTPAVSEFSTSADGEGNKHKGAEEAQTPESVRSETTALGTRNINHLEAIDSHGYYESPEHKRHHSDKSELSVNVNENEPQQHTLTSEAESDIENESSNQRVPPVPPRSHRRVLSRVAEGYEPNEHIEVPTNKKADDESAFEGIGKGDDAEMLQFMHVPVKKPGRRRTVTK